MKKIGFILMVFCLFSCDILTPPDPNLPLTGDTVVKKIEPVILDGNYEVVKIGECTYIHYWTGKDWELIHDGDCKNLRHSSLW